MPVKKFTTKVELTNTQSVSIPEEATQYHQQVAEGAVRARILDQLDMMLPPGWERGQAANGIKSQDSEYEVHRGRCKRCDRSSVAVLTALQICCDCLDEIFNDFWNNE